MQNGERHLVDIKGRYRVIETCYPLKPVVELEVEGLRVLRGEVPRGEAKVKEDKEEMFHREARPPLPEYPVDIVRNRTIPRITVGGKLKSV